MVNNYQLLTATGWFHLSPVQPRLNGQPVTYTAVPLAAWRTDAYGNTLGMISVTDDGVGRDGFTLQPAPRVRGASYITAEQLREIKNSDVVTVTTAHAAMQAPAK
ncbi:MULTISPECIES: hypothetical protein [Xanthomonas]|uniref:hypothetical protein n=1 Tax=Xanthomonas TaxID=338 RepID=UPI001C451F8C|nr:MULTISPECIES: hypothetical protein [Xanthomonas]MBV6855896.1 hypothetical protein [Xanthomonas campestris pv. mirabilis]MBV6867877.1 hypothetical protein [Xanthomonas campestris pv. coriandri]MCE4330797.1 hypothetical protein [Xanthomonas campestris pv. coriandri]MEA9776936.1 hypothetical protein [Xanthomonas campestris pv. raphani]